MYTHFCNFPFKQACKRHQAKKKLSHFWKYVFFLLKILKLYWKMNSFTCIFQYQKNIPWKTPTRKIAIHQIPPWRISPQKFPTHKITTRNISAHIFNHFVFYYYYRYQYLFFIIITVFYYYYRGRVAWWLATCAR